MGRGKLWSDEQDRLLLMYIFLTSYNYHEIASIFRENFHPWCTLTNGDIRGRMRKTPNSNPNGTLNPTIRTSPFARAIQNQRTLYGRDATDVAEFVRSRPSDALNAIGDHYMATLGTQTGDNGEQPPTGTEEDDVQPGPSGTQPVAQGPGSTPNVNMEEAGSAEGSQPGPFDYLFDAATYAQVQKNAQQTQPQPQLQTQPQAPRIRLFPVLIGTPEDVRSLAQGLITPDQFQFLTQGNDLTFLTAQQGAIARGDALLDGSTNDPAFSLGPDQICITRTQANRLHRGELTLAQLMPEIEEMVIIQVPAYHADDTPIVGPDGRRQYRIVLATGLEPRRIMDNIDPSFLDNAPQGNWRDPRWAPYGRGKKIPKAETYTKVKSKVTKPKVAKPSGKKDKVEKPQITARRRSTRNKKA